MQRKWFSAPCALAFSLLIAGCGARLKEDIGGESHFLSACDSQQSERTDCGEGLSCLGGHCTRTCSKREDCMDLARDAVCVADDGDNKVCDVPDSATCEVEGTTYKRGAQWACDCNTCMCTASGIASTKKGCATDTCVSNDETYALGDVVTFANGMSCVCLEDGFIGQCTGVPAEEAAVIDTGGPHPENDAGESLSDCEQACADAVGLDCSGHDFCIVVCEDLPSLIGNTATTCIAAADVYADCIESGPISPLVCVHVENGLEYPVAEGCVNAFFDVLACQTNCTDRYGNPCD